MLSLIKRPKKTTHIIVRPSCPVLLSITPECSTHSSILLIWPISWHVVGETRSNSWTKVTPVLPSCLNVSIWAITFSVSGWNIVRYLSWCGQGFRVYIVKKEFHFEDWTVSFCYTFNVHIVSMNKKWKTCFLWLLFFIVQYHKCWLGFAVTGLLL